MRNQSKKDNVKEPYENKQISSGWIRTFYASKASIYGFFSFLSLTLFKNFFWEYVKYFICIRSKMAKGIEGVEKKNKYLQNHHTAQ